MWEIVLWHGFFMWKTKLLPGLPIVADRERVQAVGGHKELD